MAAPSALSTAAAPHAEAAGALRNALKLGASLLCTWGIALGVRLLLPRLLGPSQFGVFAFADALTTAAFAVLTLGVDTYIRKEVSVREGHASEFFGGILLMRLALAGAVFAGLALLLSLGGQPPGTQAAVWVFGAAQLFFTASNSLAALLHARGSVDGLSVVNVVTKGVWGFGTLAAVLLGGGVAALAFAFLVSEALKALALAHLARRHLGLSFTPDLRAAARVVRASLPFYVTFVCQTAVARVGQSVLAFRGTESEVGWYGAASNLASLALLLTPLIGWVLMPLLARAAARDAEELAEKVRRSIAIILALAIPASLALAAYADVWVALLFGSAFAPSAASLALLAPVFTLTYVNIVAATSLILTGRPWAVARCSLVSLALVPLLTLALAGPGRSLLGAGGAGAAAALAVLASEALTCAWLLIALGGRAFDRASRALVLKALAGCVLVVCLDVAFRRVGVPAAPRVALGAAVYTLWVLILRAIPLAEIRQLVRAARSRHERPV